MPTILINTTTIAMQVIFCTCLVISAINYTTGFSKSWYLGSKKAIEHGAVYKKSTVNKYPNRKPILTNFKSTKITQRLLLSTLNHVENQLIHISQVN